MNNTFNFDNAIRGQRGNTSTDKLIEILTSTNVINDINVQFHIDVKNDSIGYRYKLFEFMIKYSISITEYNYVIADYIFKQELLFYVGLSDKMIKTYIAQNVDNFRNLNAHIHTIMVMNEYARYFKEWDIGEIINYSKVIDNLLTIKEPFDILKRLFCCEELSYDQKLRLNEVAEQLKFNYNFNENLSYDYRLYNLCHNTMEKHWNSFVMNDIIDKSHDLAQRNLHEKQLVFLRGKIKNNLMLLEEDDLFAINPELFPLYGQPYSKQAIRFFASQNGISILYYTAISDVRIIINLPLINNKLILIASILKSYYNNDIELLRHLLTIADITELIKDEIIPIDIGRYNIDLQSNLAKHNLINTTI